MAFRCLWILTPSTLESAIPLRDPPGEFWELFPGSKIFGKDVLPLIILDVYCEALLSEVRSADEATETNESLIEASIPR
jgi:hypothetical protein